MLLSLGKTLIRYECECWFSVNVEFHYCLDSRLGFSLVMDSVYEIRTKIISLSSAYCSTRIQFYHVELVELTNQLFLANATDNFTTKVGEIGC